MRTTLQRFLSLLLIALMGANASGQNPVVITVGGSNPDFQTITDALNSIPSNPPNPYIVNIRDGLYIEEVVLEVIGTSLVNTITLQSESQDSLAVTITSGNPAYGSVLDMGSHSILKHLSVIGNVKSVHTTDVKLLNNAISGDVNIDWGENPVLSHNVFTGNVSIERTDNCMVVNNVVSGYVNIWGTENSMLIDNVVSGNAGMTAADYSTITGNQVSGVLGLSEGGHSTITDNLVSGSLVIDDAPYSTVSSNYVGENLDVSMGQNTLVTFNQVIGSADISRCPFSIVAENQISIDLEMSYSEHSTVRSNMATGEFNSRYGDTSLFLNNVFGLNAKINYSVGSKILNNRCNGGLEVLFSENGLVIGNEVLGETGFSSSENSFYIGNTFNGVTSFTFGTDGVVTNNIFYGVTQFVYGTDGVVTNNIFYGVTNISYCDSTVLNFNNFSNTGVSSSLYFLGFIIVENNNLPLDVSGSIQDVSLLGNNYPSGISFNDPSPLFIDPLYDANLRSTNPQLTGTGQQNILVMVDIDSVWRPNPPTVGANEICLSHDTVNVFCGDSIFLGLCTLPDSGAYVWSPSLGLNLDNVQRPRVSTTESRWYVVTDAVSGFIDSIYVNVVPLTLAVSSTYNDLLCGQQTGLVATYHAGATYSWYPSDGLLSTTTSSVVATPLDTTTYYVTVNVPGCGLLTDSASVRVNPLPTAYLYLDSSDHNFFRFLNASACADTYYWDFGDATSSTDEHPEHFFPDSGGTFLITLIACNSFGCDTFQGTIYFEGVIDGIQSIEQPESFQVFPNPTTDDITISFTASDKDIEVRVFNGLGQCVYTASKKSAESVFLNLPTLPNGQYVVSIFDGELHRAQKLIVSH